MVHFTKKPGKRGSASSRKLEKKIRQHGSTKKPFHSARLLELDEDAEISKEHPEDIEDVSSAGADSEDETASPETNPYNSLLRSLNYVHAQGQAAKRRKLSVDAKSTQGTGGNSETNGSFLPLEGSENIDIPEADAESSEDDEASDDEDTSSRLDSFETHFSLLSEAAIAQAIDEQKKKSVKSKKQVGLGNWKILSQVPASDPIPIKDFEVSSSVLEKQQLKQKLRDRVPSRLSKSPSSTYLFNQILNYHDVLLCERASTSSADLKSLLTMHVLNHVLKTRDRVLKNTMKLAKSENSEQMDVRDQGFTRPKVLIILPTRQSCYKMVQKLLSFTSAEQHENKKRFEETFSSNEATIADDKPNDFKELFEGNDDDMFRLGLKFTRKTVKFFAPFYNSDIIFASPLGLRMAVGPENSKKQDFDFLSSIEVVILDQADALLMQNWDHIDFIFEHLNRQPKEAHGCDFGRVRNWYLDGNAKYLRQTIVTSRFNTPETNKLFGSYMDNVAGKTKICLDSYSGAITELNVRLKQTFNRLDVLEPFDDPNTRFKHFTSTTVPMLDKSSKDKLQLHQGLLIFIPSYMDFVRIRNYLANSVSAQNVSFGAISEYSEAPDAARARSHFLSGRHSILLYTGRAHHFKRYKIKGVRKVFFYALPENPIFYQEIAGGYLGRSIAEGLIEPGEATVTSIFSKWDALKLERIVGTQRFGNMLREKRGDIFDFA